MVGSEIAQLALPLGVKLPLWVWTSPGIAGASEFVVAVVAHVLCVVLAVLVWTCSNFLSFALPRKLF